MRTYPKQTRTLYCYKAIEADDKIIIRRHAITNYEVVSRGLVVIGYYFLGRANGISSFIHDNVKPNKMDQVLHMRVFTFNSNFDEITTWFQNSISEKAAEAKKKYEAAQQLFEKCSYCVQEDYNGVQRKTP